MFLKRETEIRTVSFFNVIIYVSEKHIASFVPLLKVPKHNPTIRRNVVVVITLINSSERKKGKF